MNESVVKKMMQGQLSPKVFEAYDTFVSIKHLNHFKVYPARMPDTVLDAVLPNAIKEFQELNAKINSDSLNDKISDYLNSYYNSGFFINKFEALFDETATMTNIRNILLDLICSTPPYKKINRGYWNNKVQRVSELDKLTKYSHSDYLDEFVEEQAPDWKQQITDEDS